MSVSLLLQGPIGPLFRDLSDHLASKGQDVVTVTFNGGDEILRSNRARHMRFRGNLRTWSRWLGHLIDVKRIDRIFLFGDARPHHRQAIRLAKERGLPVFVFEEGYLRPSYVTVEEGGVNGHSRLVRQPEFYLRHRPPHLMPTPRYPWAYTLRIVQCFIYYVAMKIRGHIYPGYRHHRPLGHVREAAAWMRSFSRALLYRTRASSHLQSLSGRDFFLVPLQVHLDSQVTMHSRFASVKSFMVEVAASFAQHGPAESLLVFKHHPMDRGYTDYSDLVVWISRRYALGDRVRYVHDLHLPTLLSKAKGVVTINSTAGLSALIHGVPTCVLGDAIYHMEGLTHQGSLDGFWRELPPVHPRLIDRFRRFVVHATQLIGTTATGIVSWDALDRRLGWLSDEGVTIVEEESREASATGVPTLV